MSEPRILVSFPSDEPPERGIKLHIPEWPLGRYDLSSVQEHLDAAASSGTYSEGLHLAVCDVVKTLHKASEIGQTALKTACTIWQRKIDELLKMRKEIHQKEVDALKAKIAELEERLAEKPSAHRTRTKSEREQ